MSTTFILALFVMPATVIAAAVWLAVRTRPRELGVRTDVDEEPLAPGGPER